MTWLAALTLPLLMTCFVTRSDLAHPLRNVPVEIYAEWSYWLVVGILALSQFLFLRVPVRLATRRPVSRRSIWLPILVSGFWLALVVWGGGFALLEVARADAVDHLQPVLLWVTGAALASWLVWTLVFLRLNRARNPRELIDLQSRWLLRGSILELLIAVPSHIVARGRGECCAGFLTFVGITTGATVMLLSFGPAVFLLYHSRWRRLKAAA